MAGVSSNQERKQIKTRKSKMNGLCFPRKKKKENRTSFSAQFDGCQGNSPALQGEMETPPDWKGAVGKQACGYKIGKRTSILQSEILPFLVRCTGCEILNLSINTAIEPTFEERSDSLFTGKYLRLSDTSTDIILQFLLA